MTRTLSILSLLVVSLGGCPLPDLTETLRQAQGVPSQPPPVASVPVQELDAVAGCWAAVLDSTTIAVTLETDATMQMDWLVEAGPIAGVLVQRGVLQAVADGWTWDLTHVRRTDFPRLNLGPPQATGGTLSVRLLRGGDQLGVLLGDRPPEAAVWLQRIPCEAP